MSGFEVQEPILNSPYEEPREHWRIVEGEEPQRAPGRRPAMYFYRPPGPAVEGGTMGAPIELKLVNRIRMQLDQWRPLALKGEGGVTRTTMELMNYWRREGRGFKLFFAQLETAETIIFLSEARSDFLQGIQIPLDEPGPHQQADGIKPLLRYGAKMATGSGKTTVMGMLAAWSILNKAANRSDSRFSDVAIVVCPNLTIKNRLRELDPSGGEASIYRTRDLIPPHAMTVLSQGKVLVTNWHIFERQAIQQGGVPARVSKVGVPLRTTEMITIGAKTTTARGARYLTENDLRRQVDLGLIKVLEEDRDDKKSLRKVKIESLRYVESDAKWVERVLGREIGNKQNLFVINDEAHHAYRIRAEADEDQLNLFEEEDDDEFEAEFVREATVWVEGLDRINRLRGVNFCADFSATPFFLARKGPDANRPFPWVVSEFGLTDAIESGLTKIPQLAVRDSSGAEIPGFFNVWQWIAKVVYEWLALDEWEQAAAYFIDTHPAVDAFVKNEGLGFAIPYLHNGQNHDYMPDFVLRLKSADKETNCLILETKGFDPLAEVKRAAAVRWTKAVNTDGRFGYWRYAMAQNPNEVIPAIETASMAGGRKRTA